MIALDANSKRTVTRFAVSVLFVLVWYTVCRMGGIGSSLDLIASAAGVAAASVAVIRKEQRLDKSFTRWDEAMAWFGIAALGHLLAF